ncbi:hypothetical protein D3C71_04890 [compost metagenome]
MREINYLENTLISELIHLFSPLHFAMAFLLNFFDDEIQIIHFYISFKYNSF